MDRLRVAVVGAGSFGKNHVRVIQQLANIELIGIVDSDLAKAQQVASEFGSTAYSSLESIRSRLEAAIIATPTVTHAHVATQLLESGIDVLVEKPIAESSAAGERLVQLAQSRGRILQVGHLERFNPAVTALSSAVTIPLFFEVHRLSVFSPRSLDVDVVLDLMIHDLDIVLSLMGQQPSDIQAAGISVLSKKVDIANVRLSFAGGCIANLTASRVSTEQIRKLRLFQPGEYISLDYHKQEAIRLAIQRSQPTPEIAFEPLSVQRGEPLRLELEAFFASVRNRSKPVVDGAGAVQALRLAELILSKISTHANLVAETLRTHNP